MWVHRVGQSLDHADGSRNGTNSQFSIHFDGHSEADTGVNDP